MIAACGFARLTWAVIIAKMGKGFERNNLRVLGIALVTTFSMFLALLSEAALTAAIGLLGGSRAPRQDSVTSWHTTNPDHSRGGVKGGV